MSEATTETPTTPIEGSPTSEAVATSLLTSTEETATTQQQEGTTTKEGDNPAAETKPAETAKPEGAPESYDFKAPEGKSYDATVLEPFSAAAKEANLTQDAAQKFLDKMAPVVAERQQAQVKAVQEEWSTATAKEFGGDKLKETKTVVSRFMNQFDPIPTGQTSTPLRTLLETTGMGNHPDLVRMIVAAGKSISEDGFVKGSAAGSQKDLASKLYPNTPSKE